MKRALAIALALLATSAHATITLDAGFPVSIQQNNATGATVTTATFSTAGANRLMVAVLSWAGASAVFPITVSGAGLTWTKQKENEFTTGSFQHLEGSAVWTAVASSQLTSQTVSVTRTNGGSAATGILTVYALAGASTTIGATGGKVDPTGSTNQTVDAPVVATAAGSWLLGAFCNGNSNTLLTANANTTLDSRTTDSGLFTSFGTGRKTTATSGAGSVAIGATDSNIYAATAAIEVLDAGGGGGPTNNPWYMGSGWGSLLLPRMFRETVRWWR